MRGAARSGVRRACADCWHGALWYVQDSKRRLRRASSPARSARRRRGSAPWKYHDGVANALHAPRKCLACETRGQAKASLCESSSTSILAEPKASLRETDFCAWGRRAWRRPGFGVRPGAGFAGPVQLLAWGVVVLPGFQASPAAGIEPCTGSSPQARNCVLVIPRWRGQRSARCAGPAPLRSWPSQRPRFARLFFCAWGRRAWRGPGCEVRPGAGVAGPVQIVGGGRQAGIRYGSG